MRLFIRLIGGATLFAATIVTAPAQDIAARADQYLSTWAAQGRFSGTVLLAKDNKILLRKSYGMANYELNVANTPDTVYRIGSITKLFTAFGILQLEEKGLLNVADPVSKFIPELPAEWNAITIHQLLCHKSGIPDYTSAKSYSELDNPFHVESSLKEFAGKPLLAKPGEVFRYSNPGYILLGRIIEKVSGKTYEDYLTENILRPAGMTHTAFDHASAVVPNRASGYRWDGENVVNATYGDPAYGAGAGALRSTVDDMYRFDRALKSGKLFSAAITAKAWTAYGHWNAPPPFPLEADYGYGWMLGQEFGHRYVGHGGWVNGFVSQFNRYPDDDAVLIVMWNFETSNNMPLTHDLAAVLFGQKYEIPVARPIVHPSQETLARYVGHYTVGPLSLDVTYHDGKIYVLGTGQPVPYGLIATSDTEFYCNDTPAILRFIPDDKGDVNQISLKFGDKEFPVIRVVEQKQGN
ncbi:MAG TPA: serine hydrolase domain-containing protein [Terracidiphilus sp.]|jgi:CubicO group peptidase (beta-lactamase class C family)